MNITRRSEDSAVTVSFGKTFRDLSQTPPPGEAREKFNFCGCGWPQHVLVPKGSEQGFPCELFVMVSNWQNDKVNTMLVIIMQIIVLSGFIAVLFWRPFSKTGF